MRSTAQVVLPCIFAAPVLAQTSISPPRIFTVSVDTSRHISMLNLPSGIELMDTTATTASALSVASDKSFFSGTGVGVWTGQNAKLNLDSKAYRVGVYGRPSCTPDPHDRSKEKCVSHLAFELAVDSYIIDAVGDQIVAVKDYVLSRKGAPLAVRLPIKARYLGSFDTMRDTVPQSWAAGEPYLNVRAIPLKTSSGDFDVNGAGAVGYTLSLHTAFLANAIPGTAYLDLTPTANWLWGGRIGSTILPQSTSSRWLAGLDYRFGYQFGGANGKTLSLDGTYSFQSVQGPYPAKPRTSGGAGRDRRSVKMTAQPAKPRMVAVVPAF